MHYPHSKLNYWSFYQRNLIWGFKSCLKLQERKFLKVVGNNKLNYHSVLASRQASATSKNRPLQPQTTGLSNINQMASATSSKWLLQPHPNGLCHLIQLVTATSTHWSVLLVSRLTRLKLTKKYVAICMLCSSWIQTCKTDGIALKYAM